MVFYRRMLISFTANMSNVNILNEAKRKGNLSKTSEAGRHHTFIDM